MKYLLILNLFLVNAYAYKAELVKDNLGIVWGMDFLQDTIIFTQRTGELRLLDLKTKKIMEVSGAPKVYARGQGGLLDIKVHPNFSKNKRVYITYAKNIGEYQTTALGYGTLESNKLLNFKDIFIAKGNGDTRRHFGSRITFAENNLIFMSIGDRGERANAQNNKNHFGTIVRLTDEGKVPAGNPFIEDKKALDEIWSYGHRNPQGLFYDKESQTLYEMEHGPRGGDEINIIEKAQNYGWPTISYGKEYMLPIAVGESTHKEGMKQPIKYYIPSIAPSGLIYYTGNVYKNLKNSLISGALAKTHLNIYFPKTKKEVRLFEKFDERFRSVAVDKAGFIYFSTDTGKIYKLQD